MHKIQELFDPSKQLNRKIESVVTFGANTTEDSTMKSRSMSLPINFTRTMRMYSKTCSWLSTIPARR